MTQLTDAEKEVLKLTAEGYEMKQIAEMLCKSVHTIEKQRFSAMRKTGGKNIIHATVIFVAKNGINPP